MKKIILFLFCIQCSFLVKAQYSVSQDVDRQFYCSNSSVMKETGKVQSFNSNTFKGFKYHFYYYVSGVYQEIGNYTATIIGASIFTSFGNLQPTYFNGSQISGATIVLSSGSTLWLSINIPYATFPNNNTGQQLAVDVEAIDQGGSTTTHSSKTLFSVPLLYTNPVTLASPSLNTTSTTVCSGVNADISSSPNYAGYGFTYDWYKDGAVYSLSDNTGAISVSSPGTYYAIVRDACQTATSESITINPGTVPGKPTISLPSLPLCNNAAGTLTANGTGGTYTWSTGATGSTLSVTAGGNYSVHESNGCGAGPESDPVTVTTASSPAAPTIASSNGTLLCNGQSTTLSTTPSAGGTIYWSNGATGNSITVSDAGSYYAYESNGCGNGPNSNTININTGSTAPTPNLSINGSVILCNGAGQTISTSPSTSGGVIHWSSGAVGNSITVYDAGNYYAYESNGCGNGPNSATVVISTMNTPGATSVTPSGSIVLCNGASTTLSSSGTNPANILWYYDGSSTGHFGTTYTISAAGSYTTRELSSCGTSPAGNTVTITSNATPPAPVLNASGTILLCDGAGQTISTTPSTSGGVIHWSTGATGNSITVSSPGNYYAWETNSSCGTGPNSATVTITTLNTPPAPSVNPPTNQLLCNGASATLTSSGNTITWSNGVTGNTLVTTTAGNYYAVDHNACGNSMNSNVVVITTGNCPIPSPGSSFFICPGTTKLLDAGAGYDSYVWNTGATTQTVNVGPGSYSVTVVKNGCTASSAVVTVSYYSVGASFISVSGPTTFCAGGSVTLSSSSGASYLWSNGATSNSIAVGVSGSYYVTVTDANGCKATSAPVTTTVNALPNASISGSATVCQNSEAPVITFNASGGSSPYTFTYKLNNGVSQTITTTSGNSVSIPVPTSAAGTYIYSLVSVQESSSTACSNSASGSVTVLVNPLPTATIAGSTTICQNSAQPQIVFTGSGATPPYTFTYSINGGASQTISTVSGNSVSLNVPTNTAGLFTYTLVSVQESSGTSCSNTVSGTASVLINPLPTATIAGNNTVCQNSVQPQIIFTGNGGTQPYTFSYKINGGAVQTVNTTSGNSVAVNVPTTTAGTFVYTLISVQESSGTSCSNSASGNATVVINPLPTANINGTSTVCQNSTAPVITFTGNGGTAPYTFTYKINGGANKTITSSSGNSVTVSVLTNVAGTYMYTLVSVQESSGTTCNNSATGTAIVVVNPVPTATVSGSTSVCQNSAAPIIVFTGSGATAPYTFTYKINNGTNQTVTTTSGNSVSVNVPTTTAGTFTYSLVIVQESSGTACSNAVTGSATVVVNPLPSATIAGTTTLCQNSTQPQIIFTGSGATAPYTFIYKINGGPNQSVTTVSGNSVFVNVPTNTPGTFVYSLISVQESGSTTCLNAVSGSATVVVNPLPTATLTGSTTVCQNSASPVLTFTGSGATAPYTFSFKINNGAVQTVSTTSGNSITVSVPTNIAGTFVYKLVSVQEASGTACSNTAGDSAIVIINPLPSATISGATTVCANSAAPQITFTGSGATAPYTFAYQINGGANQTVTTTSGNSVSVTVPTITAGTFTYSLVSVQESGNTTCINNVTGSVIVTVNPQPAKAIIAAPNSHLCNGDTGQITISNYQSGFTYTWYKDGVLFRTSTLDTIHVSLQGSYKVRVTSDKGCDAAQDSDPIIISTGVVSTPVITGYLKVCPGGKTKLVVLPTDPTQVYEFWRWTDPPGQILSGDSSFSALAGQYRVRVEREGCYDSTLVTVTADDTVYPAGKLTITPNSISYGGQVTMLADVTGAANYHWDFGDGNTVSTTVNMMSENYFVSADSIPVKVDAISERNCITHFSGSLKVSPQTNDTIPNHSMTGNLKDWNVFPIPFHGSLKVSAILKRDETVRIGLFTADGKWVRSWMLAGKKGENLFSLDKLEGLAVNVVYMITGVYNGEKHFDKVFKY